MTRPPQTSTKRGITGLLMLFCLMSAGLGLAFDFAAGANSRFWLAAEPGARAVLGAGTVLTAIAVAHVLRLLLRRRARQKPGRGGADADHA